MTTTLLLSVVLCSLSSCSAVPGPGDTLTASVAVPEVRSYDLSAIRSRHDSAPLAEILSPSLGTDLVERFSDAVEFAEDEELDAYEAFEVEWLVDLLQSVLGEEMEFEGRFLELHEGGELLVGGPPEVHAEVERVLGFVGRLFATQRELRVDVVTLPARPEVAPLAAGLHPPAAVDAWLGGLTGARARTVVLGLSSGRTAGVDLSRETTFVPDYDVEVAQGAFIYDPISSSARIGARILARGAPGPGGTWLALLVKESALDGPLVERELSMGGVIGGENGVGRFEMRTGIVQDLRLRKHAFAANAWLPDGQVLVLRSTLALRGAGEHLVVAVRRAGEVGPEPELALASAGKPRLVVFDQERSDPSVFALRAPSSWGKTLPSQLLAHPWERAWRENPLHLAAELKHPDVPALLEHLSARTTDAGGFAMRTGPWWFFEETGGAPAAAPAAKTPERDLVLVDLVLRGAGGSPVASLHVPARLGTTSFGVLGVENLAFADYDVEVAQYAATQDPVPVTLFDGLLVSVQPSRIPGGELLLDVVARAHLRVGEERDQELDGFLDVGVRTAEFEHLFAAERLVLPATGKRRAVLGDQGGAGALSLEVTVR